VKTLIPLIGLVLRPVDLPVLAPSNSSASFTDGVIAGSKATMSQAGTGNSGRVSQSRPQHILWPLGDIIK
jgi:hypothetical protein